MNIEDAIQRRHTLKVVADLNDAWPAADDDDLVPRLEPLLDLAGCAPFHYRCHESQLGPTMDSPVPWRFHVLTATACRELAKQFVVEEAAAGKIVGMLAAADAMIMTTWLPDPPQDATSDTPREIQSFEASQRNMEHIAGASAAVQNLLLAATARGWHNYWSSGGILRMDSTYDRLTIPKTQVLLGAIFLFPRDTRDAFTKPGANRETRGHRDDWSRWIRNVD